MFWRIFDQIFVFMFRKNIKLAWHHFKKIAKKIIPNVFTNFLTNIFAFVSIPGATVDAKTHAGLTALHLASECGHTSVVCALLDHNRNGGCPSLYNSKASIDTLESAARYVLIICFHESCYYESPKKNMNLSFVSSINGFSIKITVNLFWFLNGNPFRTDQNIWHRKNSSFVDSGFVKTCDELATARVPPTRNPLTSIHGPRWRTSRPCTWLLTRAIQTSSNFC